MKKSPRLKPRGFFLEDFASQKLYTVPMDSGFSWRAFWLPATILALLLLGIAGVPFTLMLATVAGVARILVESWQELRQRRYSLDYIALVAMVVALASGQFLAGAVVAFMFTGGKALEAFAEQKAHATLKALGDTIPKNAQVWRGNTFVSAPLQGIRDGEKILVKRGELVPLDGTLLSLVGGIFNLSNLTGEMEPASFRTGTFLKSGAVNVGDTAEIQVVGDFYSSTYHNSTAGGRGKSSSGSFGASFRKGKYLFYDHHFCFCGRRLSF